MAVLAVASACRASWDLNPSPKPSKFSHSGKAHPPPSSSTPLSPEMATTATATLPASPIKKEEFPATQLWNSNPNRSSRGALLARVITIADFYLMPLTCL